MPNVAAMVLGGSRARGLAQPDSDIDVGIYYREASPFPVDEVRSVAETICTAESVPIVTGMYEWGPWVNGGAWIQTPVGKVDFLYRNLDQVRAVIEEGRRGVWRHAQYRRLRSKLGAPKAITAMAHRLARLVYRMLKYGQQYVDKGAEYYERRNRQQQIEHLRNKAPQLGLHLTPAHP